jgi:hypothetical protein
MARVSSLCFSSDERVGVYVVYDIFLLQRIHIFHTSYSIVTIFMCSHDFQRRQFSTHFATFYLRICFKRSHLIPYKKLDFHEVVHACFHDFDFPLAGYCCVLGCLILNETLLAISVNKKILPL